jgi:hypothetical protein
MTTETPTRRQYIRDMGPITDGEYIVFQNDINYAINVLGHVNLNVYMDASGTIFALDTNGAPIQNALIEKMIYTYPYFDASNNPVDGFFEIIFAGGGIWTNVDAHWYEYWYSIEGILPVSIKQFT